MYMWIPLKNGKIFSNNKVAQVRLSEGGRFYKGRPTEVEFCFLFFFFPWRSNCSSQFLSLFPLFFQACPAQPLWTTNGVDPRGTARPATSTGDRDYLGIVGQCGDSASPHNVCKTELFSKQSVLAHIKCLRNLLPGLQMRCEEKGLHTGVTLVD